MKNKPDLKQVEEWKPGELTTDDIDVLLHYCLIIRLMVNPPRDFEAEKICQKCPGYDLAECPMARLKAHLQNYRPKDKNEMVVRGKIRGDFDEGMIYDIDYPFGGYDYSLQKALRGFKDKQVKVIIQPDEEK